MSDTLPKFNPPNFGYEEACAIFGKEHIKVIYKDAAFYRQMLEAARDVFGMDNMTEAVICKAIEAASYGTWRRIMDGKCDDDEIYVVR